LDGKNDGDNLTTKTKMAIGEVVENLTTKAKTAIDRSYKRNN
jgi:hypothetical protein